VGDPHESERTRMEIDGTPRRVGSGGEVEHSGIAAASRAGDAHDVLMQMLQRMGVEAAVRVTEDEERIVLDVSGSEVGLVIGKKGQTLDALQYLVNKIVNRDRDGRKPVVVDSEGYRDRRAESLIDLAHRLGEKAIRTRRVITVSPMSPHDRRIIHLALDNVPGVTTRSEGEGSFRRLLIIPEPEKM
jgi:spoIIIJ-associated protein